MSKRSGSSVPLTAERLGSKRRTNSPVSKSGGTHPACSECESNVTRARALPIERRQVAHLISPEVLRRSRLWDGMAGGDKEDPITAFKRAADALSAKRGIIDRIVSDDEVMITGSRRRTVVKTEATSSSHGRKLRDMTTMRSPPQSFGSERTSDELSSILADLNLRVAHGTRPFFRAMILRRGFRQFRVDFFGCTTWEIGYRRGVHLQPGKKSRN
ncbi:hypothetical protein Bca52824_035137 [Brassica carinata]|uniref:Uncharacterized protein n=1 Tax=Brassica carinata TaxID=52824 RepID=A0A8X7V092_BRACI|nr:hypothetical protein Bca52824_035137 [Brassica carinata]